MVFDVISAQFSMWISLICSATSVSLLLLLLLQNCINSYVSGFVGTKQRCERSDADVGA